MENEILDLMFSKVKTITERERKKGEELIDRRMDFPNFDVLVDFLHEFYVEESIELNILVNSIMPINYPGDMNCFVGNYFYDDAYFSVKKDERGYYIAMGDHDSPNSTQSIEVLLECSKSNAALRKLEIESYKKLFEEKIDDCIHGDKNFSGLQGNIEL